MDNFTIPDNHILFKAKKLDDFIEGKILNSSIAYIEPNGGGPKPSHTHKHNHYFIVIEGSATIKMENKEVIVNSENSFLVDGSILHSIWNNTDKPLKMIGMSIENNNL